MAEYLMNAGLLDLFSANCCSFLALIIYWEPYYNSIKNIIARRQQRHPAAPNWVLPEVSDGVLRHLLRYRHGWSFPTRVGLQPIIVNGRTVAWATTDAATTVVSDVSFEALIRRAQSFGIDIHYRYTSGRNVFYQKAGAYSRLPDQILDDFLVLANASVDICQIDAKGNNLLHILARHIRETKYTIYALSSDHANAVMLALIQLCRRQGLDFLTSNKDGKRPAVSRYDVYDRNWWKWFLNGPFPGFMTVEEVSKVLNFLATNWRA
jgi:hypothetical protein